MVYSDPNNTNSIVYQHTLLSYWLKTSHWNISWAATLHLYNMADRREKLQQPHCYHPFSDPSDTYLTKNHYENYSPKMVPTNPTGSWTTRDLMFCQSMCSFIVIVTHWLWGSGYNFTSISFLIHDEIELSVTFSDNALRFIINAAAPSHYLNQCWTIIYGVM